MAIRARLAPLGLPVERLPRSWELLGDVLVLRHVRRDFGVQAEVVAESYAAELGARLVLEDRAGVQGERREPTMDRLWGSGSGETTLVQDRIRYILDAERLMFSSGNLPERQRMGRVDARGEHVVDLFAGIGYFTLPLLVHGKVQRVTACEVNPLAARYLRKNATANGVDGRLEVREGDCRMVAPKHVADRVLSGWFPHGHQYLDVAMNAMRVEGGMLHYHDTARADDPEAELQGTLERAALESDRPLRSCQVRVVKSFSPGVVHAVADAAIGPLGETRNPAPLAVTRDMMNLRPGPGTSTA